MQMTLLELALEVQKVRDTQNAYFIQSAVARKTNRPEAYAEAKNILIESKRLESKLDERVTEIILSA